MSYKAYTSDQILCKRYMGIIFESKIQNYLFTEAFELNSFVKDKKILNDFIEFDEKLYRKYPKV